MTTVNPDRSSGPRIELDKSRPQSARMYDYYLGGKAIHQWRPDPAADGAAAESITPAEVSCYGLVARKP